MIQRVQSIFLLLAAVASFSLFAVPLATSGEQVASNDIFSDGVFNIMDHPGLMVFFGLAGALAAIAIFLFKNRRVQMRLTIFSVIALIIGSVLGIVYYMNNSQDLAGVEISDQIGIFLPVISIIFSLLALRFINKDENLVRSMDRLR